MFYEDKVEILDAYFNKSAEFYADVQPYDKSILFEDNHEIQITKRAFCEINPQVNPDSYIRYNSKLYKIMKIKTWSNYIECWLYECERDVS